MGSKTGGKQDEAATARATVHSGVGAAYPARKLPMRSRAKTQLVPKVRSVAEKTKRGLSGNSLNVRAVSSCCNDAANASIAVPGLLQLVGSSRRSTGSVLRFRCTKDRKGVATTSSQFATTTPGSGQVGIRSAKWAAKMLPPETDEIPSTWERMPSSFKRRSAPR